MSRAVIGLLLVLFLPGIAHASRLGRLFFTPEQRKQLDAGPGRPAANVARPATGLMLNGIIQKADGTRTIWINGVAQIEDGNGRAPDMQLVTAPGNPQPVAIKVGQRLLPEHPAQE